jgi:hypothetical protein
MKKMLAGLLMMPAVAFSQANRVDEVKLNVLCVSLETLEEVLTEYNELPMIRGKSHRADNSENPVVVFMNAKTKSWTLIEKNKSGKYCILGVGENMEPVPNNIIEDIIKERQGKKS